MKDPRWRLCVFELGGSPGQNSGEFSWRMRAATAFFHSLVLCLHTLFFVGKGGILA